MGIDWALAQSSESSNLHRKTVTTEGSASSSAMMTDDPRSVPSYRRELDIHPQYPSRDLPYRFHQSWKLQEKGNSYD